MRALLLEVPEHLLRDRRAKGLDRFDEVWEGVLHMVPPPSGPHQLMESRLLIAFHPRVEALGLEITPETGFFDPAWGDRNYRQPDLVVTRLEHRTHRGVEGGAELVVEILSPHDETYDKFGFYAAQHARRLLVVHPETCAVELYRLVEPAATEGDEAAEPAYERIEPDDQGTVLLDVLDLTLTRIDGPALRVNGPDGETVISVPEFPEQPVPTADAEPDPTDA